MSFIYVFFLIVDFIQKKSTHKGNLGCSYPFVSILIPCHNEQKVLYKHVSKIIECNNYSNYEIIIIDDGSSDNTRQVISELIIEFSNIRACLIETNCGKAHALIQGALMSNADYLLCIDADATLNEDTVRQLVSPMLNNSQLGAVTGHPFVKNRSSFLGKIQTVEFLTLINMTKRVQNYLGAIFSISGVCALFRKEALIDVGWWDQECSTEDVSITWKLQRRGWSVEFIPSAFCWMQVPSTIKELLKQRIRWAQGGTEVLIKNSLVFFAKGNFRLKLLGAEQLLSAFWAIGWFVSSPIFISKLVLTKEIPFYFYSSNFLFLITSIFLVGIAILLTFRIEYNILGVSLFFVWYIVCLWLINTIALLIGIPLGIKKIFEGGQATWKSPARD
ncbi:glycosyltransferase [Enterococcus sp. DIV0187]|uniref:glycosyltransferase n=1 Tax=Enterococcus sp. DIV0187 TaxID=2774644 RepID=UPI003F686119